MAVTPLRHEQSDEGDHALPLVPFLRLALQVLADRVLLWAVTLGAGGVWAFTVLHPDPWRIVTAIGYSLTVLLPVLGLRRRTGGE
jgi:hypothetical protein